MDHNIYKIIETHRKEFGAQSGREVLGEEYSLDNLQRVVMKPSRGWIKNQPVPKRTQAVEALCRLAWQQAPRLWNNRKFHMSQTKHEFQIYWTVHFEERIPKNLETLLFYTKKTLACCYRKQLPAREGDSWARSRLHYLFLIQNHSMLAWRTFDAARGALTFFRLTREENGIA